MCEKENNTMTIVVLDTNIIVSAIVFGGKPREVVDLVQSGRIHAYITPFILFELKEVLTKKFDFNEVKLKDVEDLIGDSFVSISPKITLDAIKKYPLDNKILEAAQEAKADYLITGDKRHILPLKTIQKTHIVTAEEFLKLNSPILYSP